MNLCNKKNIIILGGALILLVAISFHFRPSGESLFTEERCITCHRFRGQGGLTGPDLTDVSKRRSALWIFLQIRDPKSHNPSSRMPSYDHLGFLEIYSLIAYLRS